MRVKTERVRELRGCPTEAEEIAWHLLRNKRAGLKFRRQYAIENHVVDFYCFEHHLAIELDGSVHEQPSRERRDRTKDAFLKRLGIRVLRLPNGLVLEDPDGFLARIQEAIVKRS
jgi:very-short-patch-repair endonuclease